MQNEQTRAATPKETTSRSLITPILSASGVNGQIIFQTTLTWVATENQTPTKQDSADSFEVFLDGTSVAEFIYDGETVCHDGVTDFKVEYDDKTPGPPFRVSIHKNGETTPEASYLVPAVTTYMTYTTFDPTGFINNETIGEEEE